MFSWYIDCRWSRKSPDGCQDRHQTMLSWAVSMTPVSFSAPTFQYMTHPSLPPLANIPSCTGCHCTQLASFLWPRNVWSSCFRFLMSNSLSRWSLDAVSNQFPFLFQLQSITVDLCACIVNSVWPDQSEISILSTNQKSVLNFINQSEISIILCQPIRDYDIDWPDLGSQSLIGCWLSLLPLTAMITTGWKTVLENGSRIITYYSLLRMPVTALDICSVTSQHLLLVTSLEIPYSHLKNIS